MVRKKGAWSATVWLILAAAIIIVGMTILVISRNQSQSLLTTIGEALLFL